MAVTNPLFSFYGGDDFVIRINLGQVRADGSPLDLTGYTARWSAELEPAAVAVSGSSIVVVRPGQAVTIPGACVLTTDDAGNWLMQVTLDHTSTAIPGTYAQQAWIISPSGDVHTVEVGPMEVIGSLARPV